MSVRGIAEHREFIAPRRYVPKELRSARVGDIDMGSLTLAYLIKKRAALSGVIVVIDININGHVYAGQQRGETIQGVVDMHPELIVGTYNRQADVADIAADVEAFLRRRFV